MMAYKKILSPISDLRSEAVKYILAHPPTAEGQSLTILVSPGGIKELKEPPFDLIGGADSFLWLNYRSKSEWEWTVEDGRKIIYSWWTGFRLIWEPIDK